MFMYNNKYNFGEKTYIWNPWRGCFKITEACENCYVKPENTFEDCYYPLPHGNAKAGTVITVSLRSDFFLEEADKYRYKAWEEIKNNPNLIFLIITKRVDRIAECLPDDWGDGWDNVIIDVTAENQKRADERLPVLLGLPLKHKWVACSPLLEAIDLTPYLSTGKIEVVETLGEKAYTMPARPIRYEWVKALCEQCVEYNVRFSVLYIGHNFIMPDGTVIKDNCTCYHSQLADSLDLFHYKPITFKLQNSTITY